MKNEKNNRNLPYHFLKGGRPTLGTGLYDKELKDFLFKNKMSERIVIKLSKEELVLVNKKYAFFKKTINMNRSDFIKKIIFEEDLKQIIDSRNNARLIIEINRIGVNINQVVKRINSLNYTAVDQIDRLENFTSVLLTFFNRLKN